MRGHAEIAETADGQTGYWQFILFFFYGEGSGTVEQAF